MLNALLMAEVLKGADKTRPSMTWLICCSVRPPNLRNLTHVFNADHARFLAILGHW
jgi:hypothetical protein